MSANASLQLQRVEEKGWKRGLSTLLQGEYSAWFKSSRWWKHILIWFAIINGMMGTMIYATAEAAKDGIAGPPMFFMYGLFGGMTVAFGVMIIMQRVIVGEKRSGTAAWVLSKPVTRTAFVVSRLVINTIAILLTSVILPGVIFYFSLGLFSRLGWLSLPGFASGLLVIALHTLYWIALVLMMGTLSESSSVVIAVPMALYFAFWFGSGLIPRLVFISPLLLTFSPDLDNISPVAASLMSGEPVFSWMPVISTIVFSIIFIVVAIARFNRQEF